MLHRTLRPALLLFALAGSAPPAGALPDLVPEILSVSVDSNSTVDAEDVAEGCAGGQTGRTLVNFGLATHNVGADDLVMGDPGCPNCSSNPGAACENPLYHCSPAHGHAHFEEYVGAELIDGNGQVVSRGRKQGFCLLDSECGDPVYTCSFQGISAGCTDVYRAALPCQYIDITDDDLPDGLYTLRLTVDPDDALPEEDETNNQSTTLVRIGGGGAPPPPTCPVYTASDLPRAIPDQGSAVSTLQVPIVSEVDRLRVVDLRGTHSLVGDLEFHLRSPQGTDVVILDGDVCGPSADFQLDLIDGPGAIQCPLTVGGLFPPSHPLAAFAGEAAQGTWTLEVIDRAPGETGTLEGFGLEVCSPCGNGIVEPGEVCDDGNQSGGDCCSPDCATAAPDGQSCDDLAACTIGGTCEAGACVDTMPGCGSCLTCDALAGCVPPPNPLCASMPAKNSRFALRKGGPRHNALFWTWTGSFPVAAEDFGSPTDVTDLTLCVYDDTGLRLSATAPAGGTCGARDCWSESPRVLRYRDRERTPDGLDKLVLRPGDAGRARIEARGRGERLAVGDVAMAGEVTVRLTRSGGPACWQAEFPEANRNGPSLYRAKVRN